MQAGHACREGLDLNKMDLQLELAPVSEAVTEGIRVEVLSRHSPENSLPGEDKWVFQYTVRITNESSAPVQLLSRHWYITDGWGYVREVEGPGVIGEQPLLAPGESHKYSSWCPISTATGSMRGTYRMVSEGREFDIEVAPFGLRARYTVQ